MRKKAIIFTDLDGTLLDSDYSCRQAVAALKLIKALHVPLILCSSKTRAEIERIRKKLDNKDPFISENGGGIFFAKKSKGLKKKFSLTEESDYLVLKLGAPYADLRNEINELRKEGFDLKGFGDMTVKEVAELTGLTVSDARLAIKRDFDEPFVFSGDSAAERSLKKRIKVRGFNFTQGEFFHLMGDSDKGRAVEKVMQAFEVKEQGLITIALGDSPNDIEMLQRVDYPVVVQKKDGSYNEAITRAVKGCIKAPGIGPDGWNRAVLDLLQKIR